MNHSESLFWYSYVHVKRKIFKKATIMPNLVFKSAIFGQFYTYCIVYTRPCVEVVFRALENIVCILINFS